MSANFLDDCFGENVQIEARLEEAHAAMKRDEAKNAAKVLGFKNKFSNNTRKADYKEFVIQVMQHRGLNSLYLRIAFWINKLITIIYRPKQERHDKPQMNFELQGVQKLQLKNQVIFLKFQ